LVFINGTVAYVSDAVQTAIVGMVVNAGIVEHSGMIGIIAYAGSAVPCEIKDIIGKDVAVEYAKKSVMKAITGTVAFATDAVQREIKTISGMDADVKGAERFGNTNGLAVFAMSAILIVMNGTGASVRTVSLFAMKDILFPGVNVRDVE